MLLSSAALGCAGVGLGVLAAPKAQAFSLEEPSHPLASQYLAARTACAQGKGPFHTQMIADIERQLTEEHVPADQQERIIAGMKCPLCGCSLG